MITVICIQCGKVFESKNYRKNTAKFCSTKCHGKWMSLNLHGESHPKWTTVESKCIECGKKMLVSANIVKKIGNFCSRDCWQIWRQKNRSPKYIGSVEKTCEFCGKIFFTKPSRKNKSRFCSHLCYSKSLVVDKMKVCKLCSKRFSPKTHNGTAKYCSSECQRLAFQKQISRTCIQCGKQFTKNPYHVKRGWAKFCSSKCHGEWKSEHLTGENSPTWKGGLSFEPYCPKFNKEFKERVREFFGRRCVECEKTEDENGRRLDVHHVNYDKMVCCNGEKPLFVATCRTHNVKANTDRARWECHYTEIIMTKYSGKCYFTKEEMKSRRK